MEKHEDFNVGCPKCKCIVFDSTKGVVLRRIHSTAGDGLGTYKRDLFRCAGCGSLVQMLDDGGLVIIEVELKKEVANADKPSS